MYSRIQRQLPAYKNERVLFINSQVLGSTLRPEKLAIKLPGWIHEVFKRDIVLIPLNKDYHWTLLILYNMGKTIPNAASYIAHVDSLGGTLPPETLFAVSDLLLEYKKKMNQHINLQFKVALRSPIEVEAPRQSDFSACGFYVMEYTKRIVAQQFPIRIRSDAPEQSFRAILDPDTPINATSTRTWLSSEVDAFENEQQL